MAIRVDPKEQEWQRKLTKDGGGIDSLSSNYLPADAWDSLLESSGEGSLLQFPKDLGYNPELKNYILFDFYDTGGDALIQQRSAFMTDTEELIELGKADPLLKDSIVEQEKVEELQTNAAINFTGAGLGYLAGGGVGAAGAYAGLSFITSGNAKNLLDAALGANRVTKSALQNARAGRGLASFSSSRLGFADKVTRAKLSVALPMNAQLNSSYSMEYEETDFTSMINVLSSAKGLQTIVEGGDAFVDEAKEMARKVGSMPTALTETITKIFGNDTELPILQFQEAANRQTPNRFKEQLFKGVGRRTFSFSWEFTPFNKEDVIKIYSIIYAFKKFSHPKLSSGGLFLDFPGQFKIGFFTGTKQNDFLFRIGMCACTKVEVTYGGKDLNFFREFMATVPPFSESAKAFGAPANSIKLSLDFTELELLTRERIQQGY